MRINRRGFINSLLTIGSLGVLGSVIYPLVGYIIPPKEGESNVSSLKIGKLDEFEINSSKIIRFGRTPVILIRDEQGTFTALAATCTHLECIVSYKKDQKQIVCACHNGVYDLKGRNVSGPPPKPLKEFIVTVKNDEIFVSANQG